MQHTHTDKKKFKRLVTSILQFFLQKKYIVDSAPAKDRSDKKTPYYLI